MKYVIYGHSQKEFSKGWSDFEDFLRNELKHEKRYRYSQSKEADIILLSFNGLLKGELIVKGKEKPVKNDLLDYEKVYGKKPKTVYLIDEIRIYKNNEGISLKELGIENIQFGKTISAEIYSEISTKTNGFEILT